MLWTLWFLGRTSPIMDTTARTATATTLLLDLTPKLIQEDLLANATFRRAYGMDSAVMLSFATGEVTFSRSALYSAIRKVLSGRSGVRVRDTRNNRWHVRSEHVPNRVPALFLVRGKRSIALPQFRVLSPNPSIRISVLNDISDDVRLPTHDRWLKVASELALADNEMDEFNDDVHDTPANFARVIRDEIASGRFRLSSVVPSRSRYYSRLVGRYDSAASVADHCKASTADFIRDLCAWGPPDGVLQALTLSCSGIAASLISLDSLDDSYIAKLFSQLDSHGDRLSQTGAVEIALRALPKYTHIERHILSMVRQIRDDDDNREESDYRLIAGLFRAIDGELARRCTFPFGRPYYRRFAALAQSTMVAREISVGRIKRADFTTWLSQLPNTRFLLQNYVDMRMEPRWSPLSFDARALKSACIGRIVAVAHECAENILSEDLRDVFLEGDQKSVLKQFESDITCLAEYPGPLSATAGSSGRMPDELRAKVEQKVGTGAVDPSSLILFANAATMFDVSEEHAVQVAENLKANRHRISGTEDGSQMFDIVMRLAVAAATCRSEALADELRVIARTDKSDKGLFRGVFKSINVCLSSAASRTGVQEWAEYVGDWLTELAFLDLKDEEAATLASSLRCLMEIVPELWRTCARAEAALQAQLGR